MNSEIEDMKLKKCPNCLSLLNRQHGKQVESVYVTIKNPVICLFLYLSGVHFRGKLQHLGDVSEYWPIY